VKRINLNKIMEHISAPSKKFLAFAVLGLAAIALATPPLGFVLNQILAKGVTTHNIRQQVEIVDPPVNSDKDEDHPGQAGGNRAAETWDAEVHAHGATDFYIQRLVLAPGGYSGWHSHPGILMGTVVSGSIDFFNDKCEKHTVNAGEMYFENANAHGIINNGSVNADLSIAYLIKHNAPRRLEASAPVCASTTGIP
jgi:quercetin dioxygenase-like cupin family protein